MERENLRQNPAGIPAKHISSPNSQRRNACMEHYGKPLYRCLHVTEDTEDSACGPRALTED